MRFFYILLICLVGCKAGKVSSPSTVITPEKILYKEVDGIKLYLYSFKPDNFDSADSFSAAVFFFGGGWVGGSHTHFEQQAAYLAQRGMVCFTADYRIFNTHGTNPIAAIEDAKSAMRFLRANAQQLKINPNNIAAGGGSAGGHLAAATAALKTINAIGDDISIDPSPNALLLFNPVIDNGPDGFRGRFEALFTDQYAELSPMHNITADMPPTLFMLGTNDALVPVSTAERYAENMTTAGAKCKLVLYENQTHGFFNVDKSIGTSDKSTYFYETIKETDNFLVQLGYLQATQKSVISYFD